MRPSFVVALSLAAASARAGTAAVPRLSVPLSPTPVVAQLALDLAAVSPAGGIAALPPSAIPVTPAVWSGLRAVAAAVPARPDAAPAAAPAERAAAEKRLAAAQEILGRRFPAGAFERLDERTRAAALDELWDGWRARGLLEEPAALALPESDPLAPRRVARAGPTRGEGWSVDGRAVRRLGGGAFKEALEVPGRPDLALKLFSEAGARDAASSLSEKRRELRRSTALRAVGRAPAVLGEGATELRTPSGARTVGYLVQERVAGRELADLLADRDPAVRAGALREARALFDDLVRARVRLSDENKMAENIMVGRTASLSARALVVDAGEAESVPAQGAWDRLRGRPDPLRGYYDRVLRALEARARLSPARR